MTKAGEAALAKIREAASRIYQQATLDLRDEEIVLLNDLLGRMRSAML